MAIDVTVVSLSTSRCYGLALLSLVAFSLHQGCNGSLGDDSNEAMRRKYWRGGGCIDSYGKGDESRVGNGSVWFRFLPKP